MCIYSCHLSTGKNSTFNFSNINVLEAPPSTIPIKVDYLQCEFLVCEDTQSNLCPRKYWKIVSRAQQKLVQVSIIEVPWVPHRDNQGGSVCCLSHTCECPYILIVILPVQQILYHSKLISQSYNRSLQPSITP